MVHSVPLSDKYGRRCDHEREAGVCIWRYDAKNSATEKSAASSHSNPAPNKLSLVPRRPGDSSLPADGRLGTRLEQAILSTTLLARSRVQLTRKHIAERVGGAKGPPGA